MGRLGLARGNVQFSKIKLNVSCRVHQPAAGREGRREEGQLGYLGDRAEFINTYSHPRAARLGHQLHHPHRHSLQPALLDTQLQHHLSRICIRICNTPPNNYSVVKS